MNTPVLSPVSAEHSLLPGLNVLLEGPTGVGKTHSLGTLVEVSPQLEVFYLAMESGRESLMGYWTDRGKPVPDNLHWASVASPDYSFDSMIAMAHQISTLSNDALAKVEDMNKQKHNQFIKLLTLLSNFTDERTGKSFGPVDKWGPDRVLIVDALTGVNNASMSMKVGAKAIKSLVDWGVAMDQVERLIRQLCDGCKCHFVLLAHIERETDQVLGGVKITTGTLGQKLAGKIPPMFSDVILAKRQGTNFTWSTADPAADLKARNLAIAEGLPPSFKPVFEKWLSRGGRFTSTVKV